MEKVVTIYTQPSCPPCQVVKQFLNHHNVSYIEKDVSLDAQARDKLVFELESTSTPTVTIDDQVVTGFDLQRLEEILGLNQKK